MYPSSKQNLTYETDTAIYFFSGPFDPLNNWSAHAVEIWGERFPTIEHAYHWRKFSETAPEVATEILAAPSPWATMQIDRRHKAKRRTDWHDVKVAIMTEIVQAKVAQNQDVREMLLATGTKQIIENSPVDAFWGCGENGDGRNQMGKILMSIRDKLQ